MGVEWEMMAIFTLTINNKISLSLENGWKSK